MDNFKIEWNGEAVMDDIKVAINIASKKTAQKIFESVKNTTDFKDKTGNLRRGIKLFKSKYKNGGYIVMSTAPHAALVEYGHALVKGGTLTSNRSAKNPQNTMKGAEIGTVAPVPYMRNALKKWKNKGEQNFFDEINKALRQSSSYIDDSFEAWMKTG